MSQALFDKIESEQYRAEPLEFNVGDIVKVHTRVRRVERNGHRYFRALLLPAGGVV